MTEARPAVALILAGGLGTRLRAVVDDRPKVLAEVAGRPFLALLLDRVAAAGFERAVLCTGYMGAQVEHAFGARYGALRLDYSHESRPLGTGGAIRNALPLLAREAAVLALNGDSIVDTDLGAFMDWHARAATAGGSIVVARVRDCARYGVVELDSSNRVVRFVEKRGAHAPGLVNAGVYIFETNSIRSWASSTPLSLERDVLPGAIADGLRAFRTNGTLIDIGTPESYRGAAAALGPESGPDGTP